jgi:hypothetical protein
MISLLLIILLVTSTVATISTSSTKPQTVSPSFPSAGSTCGGISPLTRWARTNRTDTIQMNIDTSSCRFENTPTYFTSITGTAGHYLLVGVNAIYEPTPSSFHIDVRSLDRQDADTMMAWSAEFQWNVNWFGYVSS